MAEPHAFGSRVSASRDAATGGPAVSVIMPCFNGGERLRESVGSVQRQTSGDWELFVVDDGSTDGSWEILESIQDDRIRRIRQANGGPSAARNRGLAEARGRFIAFLDADDSWDPSFLATMVEALGGQPEAVLAYCGWRNLGVSGGRGAPFVPPEYETADKGETLLGGCRWPIHAALTRAEAIREAGGFDESMRAAVDYDLWLRVATRGTLVRVSEVLAFYHHHGGEQVTKNHLRLAMSHWRAQRKFLDAHPEVRRRLGRRRVRQLLYGELLRRAYGAYWARDLGTARSLFRAVMRHGYGGVRDWLYMLPSLLPEELHGRLLTLRDGRRQ